MTLNPYPPETLPDDEDDGTMPASLDALREAVVGHRIVSASLHEPTEYRGVYGSHTGNMTITLDNGHTVEMIGEADCCAFSTVESFVLNAANIDHIITGVGTTDGYTTWHVFADFGDVMAMEVEWSCGNPFYYLYGFTIRVSTPTTEEPPE